MLQSSISKDGGNSIAIILLCELPPSKLTALDGLDLSRGLGLGEV